MAEPPASLRADVEQRIGEAAKPHPWLHSAMIVGELPDISQIAAEEGLLALYSVVGGIISAIDLLAAEIDNLKGHSEPPVRS
jgi:hypothetical protein